MREIHLEWDKAKATANIKKHGVSFEEAKSVFADEQAKLIADPDHSEDEERFILLGYINFAAFGGLSLLPLRRKRHPHNFRA